MKDEAKTRGELLAELSELAQRVADMESLEREHTLAEERLEEIEDRYKALFDRSVYCVYLHDFEGRFLDANKAALDLLGYTHEEITSLHWSSILDEKELPKAIKSLEEIKRTGFEEKPNEFKLRKKDGSPVWVQTEASLIFRKGMPYAIQGIAIDITLRKRTEEALRGLLEEKEILLKEVHHRVKNNLQVISSLLDLKSIETGNRQIMNLCLDARAKVHTIALIHTHLYQSHSLTQIDMAKYIKDLVEYLSQVYSEKRKFVTPILRCSKVYLSVTQAMPCAIVLNEAISNAFKHAFKKGQKGAIEISVEQAAGDMLFIRIRDNGVGFGKDINLNEIDTLGLKLMRNIVYDQLKGMLRIEHNKGTGIFVEFKILKEEETYGKDYGGR